MTIRVYAHGHPQDLLQKGGGGQSVTAGRVSIVSSLKLKLIFTKRFEQNLVTYFQLHLHD